MTNIQEVIERSIFKAINNVFIANGYSPDLKDNSRYLDIATGDANLKADLDQIKSNKGFSVMQYGAGSSFDKDTKLVPRIVIEPEMILPGDLGNDAFTPFYETNPQNPNTLIKYNLPYDTQDMNIDVHLVYKTAKQSRILHGLVSDAIGTRAYLPRYDYPNQTFFIQHYNYYNLADSDHGIEERVYSYQVKDLYITSNKVIDNNIARIKQITTDIKIVELNQFNALIGIEVDEKLIIPLSI